jgi:hypothetical protein
MECPARSRGHRPHWQAGEARSLTDMSTDFPLHSAVLPEIRDQVALGKENSWPICLLENFCLDRPVLLKLSIFLPS